MDFGVISTKNIQHINSNRNIIADSLSRNFKIAEKKAEIEFNEILRKIQQAADDESRLINAIYILYEHIGHPDPRRTVKLLSKYLKVKNFKA